MKKLYLLLSLSLLAFITHQGKAQAPQGMNYQAVARDAGGVIIANQPISIRLTITDGSNGQAVYQETHSPTTNQFGLFSLNVGNGTPVSGTFSTINWATTNAWMNVDMDVTGGTNWVTMGSSQFLSVPYALHAATAGDNKWTSNSTNISNNNIGNVGIGTTSPGNKLSVIQSGNTGGAAYFSQVNSASPVDAVMIDNNSDGSSLVCSAYGNGNAGYFAVSNAGSSADAIVAQNNGYGDAIAGIHSGSGVAVYGYQTGIGNAAFFQTNNTANTVNALTSLCNGFGAAAYFANTGATGPALITGAGNVGIGVSSPSAKLHVNGTFRLTDGSQAQNSVLTGDQYGNASWAPLPTNPSANTGFRVYSSSSQTVASGVTTQVSWSEEYDDPNAFASDAFTVPSNGVYHFNINLMGNLNNTALMNYFQELILEKNGVEVARTYGTNLQNAQVEYSFTLNTDLKVNAGDVMTVWVRQYGAQVMTIFPAKEYCWFSGHKIY